MSLLTNHAADYFHGQPPFEVPLPQTSAEIQQLAGADVAVYADPATVLAAIRDWPPTRAVELVELLGRADTATAVYDHESHVDVKTAAASTGLLDGRRTFEVLQWLDGDDDDRAMATIARAAGPATLARGFLAQHGPVPDTLLGLVCTQVLDGDDPDLIVQVAVRAELEFSHWLGGDLVIAAADLLERRQEPTSWTNACVWEDLAVELVVRSVEDRGPVNPGELIAATSFTDRGRQLLCDLLVASSAPLPAAVVKLIAPELVQRAHARAWSTLQKLLPHVDADAAEWLASHANVRYRLLALYNPHLDPRRRAELLTTADPCAVPPGTVTDAELAQILATHGGTDGLRNLIDATLDADGGWRMPLPVADVLLETRAGRELLCQQTREQAWTDELVARFAQRCPDQLDLLGAVTDNVHGPLRQQVLSQISEAQLADLLDGTGPFQLTTDDVDVLYRDRRDSVDRQVVAWSNRLRFGAVPCWLDTAAAQVAGPVGQFGPPLLAQLFAAAHVRFGRDRERWQMLLAVGHDWQGTIGGLLDVVEDLVTRR